MKVCTCKKCGHVYASKRIRPFCSNSCRQAFMTIYPIPAILIGAINETSNTSYNQG
ncbi:hypothetical protein SAMN05444064_10225 [Pseudomonas syringae]|uniref:DNA gyrase inhibitor YacG n=1 Tax=Pseudomonas syringae TaxID=317 RepID=A0A1I4I746_PSESX|nr:hypothetical protein SAMN05444514_102385 [Pseudomonas syringae]SFL50075.1 hypothetical protein SAMN05444064_10225 [Pseudomonas syringae]SOS40286.1 hypothetical protein CFBP3840_03244 [Pseudomonas syringae]SPD81820.1 hypothetical protein PSCFBP2116_02303 [Pseudomonas syringae]